MENQTTTNQTKNHSGFGTAALVLELSGRGYLLFQLLIM